MITTLLFTLLYFLPTFMAARRRQPFAGMFFLNLFLGWTVIGWAVLLFWALVREARTVYVPYGAPMPPGAYRC